MSYKKLRCNNCGYDNKPERKRCEKCNAPLVGSMVNNSDDKLDIDSGEEKDEGTIKGMEVKIDPWDCPQCGRPVVPGAGACNQCGYIFSKKTTEPEKNGGNAQKAEKKAQEKELFRKKGLNPGGTIDPYSKGFILQPIATEYDGELAEIKVKANSDEIEVGRSLLDPENLTISSRQAIFFYRNGKWYVKDISSHKTTFIYCNEYIEIEEGDIILMGNRKFIFRK